MKQFKVENCLVDGKVFINLNGLNGREIEVPAKGFVFLKEEELSWVISQSKAFDRGILRVAKTDEEDLPEEIKLEIPQTKNALTVKDIPYFLGLTQAKLTKDIKEISREDFLRQLVKEATEADKPIKFVESIEKRIEELLLERGL